MSTNKLQRYAAFLRGVSPMNLRMPDLKACLESAGFKDVVTVLSSGNVVFSGPRAPATTMAHTVEAALEKQLGRTFMTIVRSVESLRALLDSDPFAAFKLPTNAKRVVTFLVKPHKANLALPLELDDARILAFDGCDVFSAYVPGPKGPTFMTLIEKTFGKDVTTRTWDTVRKVAAK